MRFVLTLNTNIYAQGEGFLRAFAITLHQSALVRGLVQVAFPSPEKTNPGQLIAGASKIASAVQGSLRVFESLLAKGLEKGLVDYRRGRMRFEVPALSRLAEGIRSQHQHRQRISRQKLQGSPVAATLAANFGALDLATLTELSRLGKEDFEAELGYLCDHHEVFVQEAPAFIVTLRDPQRVDVSDQLAWPLSRPFSDANDAKSRALKLVSHLAPWMKTQAFEALHHLERASCQWRFAEAILDLLEPLIRGLLSSQQGEQADQLCRELQTRDGILGLRALRLGAELEVARGEFARALEKLSTIATREWKIDPQIESELSAAHSIRAYLELLRGDLDRAAQALDLGLDRGERAGGYHRSSTENFHRARLLTLRATLHTRIGDLEAAADDYRAAMKIWRSLGRSADLAATRANFALLLERRGEADQAYDELADAVRVLENCGRLDQLAASHANLGALQDRRGKLDEAAWCHRRAAFLFGLVGDYRRAGASRASVCIAELGRVPLVATRRELAAARKVMGEDADPRARAIVAEHQARVALALGRRAEFRQQMKSAIAAGELTSSDETVRTLKDLGNSEPWRALEGTPASLSFAPAFLADEQARDPITRGLGLLSKIRDGEPKDAQQHWRRLLRSLDTWEQEMTLRQKTLFRSLVVNPAFFALRRELDSQLSEHPQGSGGDIVGYAKHLFASDSPEEAWSTLVKKTTRDTPALRAAVIDVTGNREFTILVASKGLKKNELSRNFISRLSDQDQAFFVADAGSDEQLGFAESVRRLGLLSVGGIPIDHPGEAKRWLYVDAPIEVGAFDDEAISQLTALSDLTAAFVGSYRFQPLDPDERRRLRDEITSRVEELEHKREHNGQGEIPGRSRKVGQLNFLIRKAAASDLDVLIQGESGVGKELVAEALHVRSSRRAAPFITIDLAALPESLFERELFGHEAGAFSGAHESHPGLLRLASGGTVFFDGVDQLAKSLQSKLLRVLESRRLRPLGGTGDVEVDLRVLSSARQSLRDNPNFREDLYYRLARIEIEVPALRERMEDLDLLLQSFADRMGRSKLQFDSAAWAGLENYGWPGNIRELSNLVERLHAFVAPQRKVTVADLPRTILKGDAGRPQTIDDAVRTALKNAMDWSNGQKSLAAKALGISRSTLYKKLEEYGEA